MGQSSGNTLCVASGRVMSSGEQQKMITLVQKETSPKELFQYLIELLDTYPYQKFMVIWQRKQLDDLLEDLPLVMLLVFMIVQRVMPARDKMKIQSQYFDVNKASLHITVMFHNTTMEHVFVIATTQCRILTSSCPVTHCKILN